MCALLNCSESENINMGGDYFPLTENSKWENLWEHFYYSTHDLMATDTAEIVIKGDTILDGVVYKKIVYEHGGIKEIVRKQDGKYYSRSLMYGAFMKEYLFLDERAKVNTIWRHFKNDSTDLTEYRVSAVNSTWAYNSIEYKNVMEMEVNHYYLSGKEYLLSYSTLHYYAKGIGEIFAYYPAGALTYSDLKISLIRYNDAMSN